ncbi:MAG: putative quinol monooxygenase [Marinobacter sp.]
MRSIAVKRVILKGHTLVPDRDLGAVLQELPTHTELTRNEPGCLTFEVTPDADNPNLFHVYEAFVDRQAFEAHQTRVRNSHWRLVSAAVERHYEIGESG